MLLSIVACGEKETKTQTETVKTEIKETGEVIESTSVSEVAIYGEEEDAYGYEVFDHIRNQEEIDLELM